MPTATTELRPADRAVEAESVETGAGILPLNFEKPAARKYAFDLSKMSAILGELEGLLALQGVQSVDVEGTPYNMILGGEESVKGSLGAKALRKNTYEENAFHRAILAMDTQKGMVALAFPSELRDGPHGFSTVKTAAGQISKSLTDLSLSGRIKVTMRKDWAKRWTYQPQVMPKKIRDLLPVKPPADEVSEAKLNFARLEAAGIELDADIPQHREIMDIRDTMNAWAMASAKLKTVVIKRF